jgi:hypothetical protein
MIDILKIGINAESGSGQNVDIILSQFLLVLVLWIFSVTTNDKYRNYGRL